MTIGINSIFLPNKKDYWHRRFSDSPEREYAIDGRFRGNEEQALIYLLSNRNFSYSEAKEFIKLIVQI